jgi:integrase
VKKIASLKPRSSRYEVSDGRGVFLVVHPSDKRTWVFRYRDPKTGSARKLTLGEIDGPLARERADEARRKVKAGFDPAAEAKVEKAKARDRSNLVRDFIDTYMLEYGKDKKASSVAEVARLFERWVKPAIGDKRVVDVTGDDIQAILARMVKGGAPVSANRLLAALRPFFAWVRIGNRPLPHLPTADVVRPTNEEGRDRDRVLSPAEILWLWRATDNDTAFSNAIRLMLLTGQRRGEVAGMVSTELNGFDSAKPVWLIPKARAKNSRENLVPLTALALAAIKRPLHIGRSKLIFTSSTGTELSGWTKSKAALDAKMLAIATEITGRPPNIEPWVIHDLRRTCATGLAEIKVPVHVIEAVLNHKTGAITKLAGTYNRHSYADEKREALEAWSARVTEIANA